jgi:hypothetical protein
MSAPKLKSALVSAGVLAFVILAAIGFGHYVYPERPVLVWSLLFVCWACYRLRMRAVALFGSKPVRVEDRADSPRG